jgi:hypothetical protein
MIVISFGVRKSGSTLAFETAKAILELDGYPQTRLPDEFVKERPEVNQVDRWTDEVLMRLIEHTKDTKIVIRTHAAPNPLSIGRILGAVDAGDVRIHLVYRDPRDTFLSMLDERARKGKSCDADEITERLRRNLRNLRRWGSLPSLKLCYDDLAYDPSLAPRLIADDLGVTTDPAEVARVAGDRGTRKNVGRPHRYQTEMSPDDAVRIEQAFPEYLALVEHHDLGWFHRAGDAARPERAT